MVDFLNENPIILGLLIAVPFGIELWFLIFSYERYRSFILRAPLVNLLISEPESRIVTISVTLLFFVAGLAVIASGLGIFSRTFWMVVLSATAINFLGTLAHYWWRKWKKHKLPPIKYSDLKNPARRHNQARSVSKASQSKPAQSDSKDT